MFIEEFFYKWLLWKLKKNANQEYLSIKEREDLEKRFSAMEKKLLQIVPSSEVVNRFKYLLDLRREPYTPEEIFAAGQNAFLEDMSCDEAYSDFAHKAEKKREEIRNRVEWQTGYKYILCYIKKANMPETFLDEFMNVYLNLTGVLMAHEYDFFQLGFNAFQLYSFVFSINF